MRRETRTIKVSKDLTASEAIQMYRHYGRNTNGRLNPMVADRISANIDNGKIDREQKEKHKKSHAHGLSAQEFKQRMMQDHKRIVEVC